MSLRAYLPSSTFAVMVGSLALSGGLVAAAQYVTHPPQRAADASINASQNQPTSADWEQTLRDLQAQTGIQAPQAPDKNIVQTLLTEAQTTNLTDQVGRNLLINLGSYSAQGLGQDAPTQDQLISEAAQQINASASSTSYTSRDLSVVAATNASLKTYGNAAMVALQSDPHASVQQTYLIVGQAVDAQNGEGLPALKPIGEAYGRLAQNLLATPVPQTLAPLHLKLANDYAAMAAAYPDMEQVVADPLRGMAAVQRYASAMDEAARVLTSIAQALNKDGILFNKDEPGNGWSAFLSAYSS